MSDFTFKVDTASFPNKPLNDPDVGVDLVKATAGYSGTQKLGGISFGFGVSGDASVQVFNSEEDKDGDGVLGKTVEDKPFKVTLPPQIEWNSENAWLKYRSSAAIKGSASGGAAPVEGKVEFSKEAIFTDLHVHPKQENTISAITADLTRLRFAANPDDILMLREQEALSYQVRGRLFASITLSWSDVLVGSVSTLSQLLKAGELLALKVSASASATFHVQLLDDFRVIFTKGKGTRTRIALKKADSREFGASAAIQIVVGFADEKALQDVLTNGLEAIAGEPIAAIDDIFSKASLDDLTEPQKKIVGELVKRLGLEEFAQSLQKLKEQWEALKKKLADTISDVATAKVKLGFTYDYLRIRSEDSLLIAEVEADTLRRFHNDLMLCNFQRLLDSMTTDSTSGELIKYLNQQTLKRSHAWGFSLGIGKYNVGGKDKRELTSVVQHNERLDERLAYQGMRGYDGSWLQDSAGWIVDFKAQMEDFQKAGTALASQFKYGLALKWDWKEEKLKEDELRGFLDNAVLWRIVGPDQVKDILESIKPNFGKTAKVSQELVLEDDVLRALLPHAVVAVDTDAPARAFAKSMPFLDMYVARQSLDTREALYWEIWQSYFAEDERDIDSYARFASQKVSQIASAKQIKGGADLARLEKEGFGISSKPYEDPRTFAGQLYRNGKTVDDYSGIHRNWESFASGLKRLNEAVKPGSVHPHKEIEEIFGLLAKFFGQSLFIRTAGTFLIDVAQGHKDILRKAKRSFTITLSNGDVIAFGGSM